MGQGLSCSSRGEYGGMFSAVQVGDMVSVEALLERDLSVLHQSSVYDRLSALPVAAANGQIETPLMSAAMHGKLSCVLRLIQAGANILMFDSIRGRTCLHYAVYYGHKECLRA